MEKIIRESGFDKNKKKPRFKFSPGLALSGVWTTGPWPQPFTWKWTPELSFEKETKGISKMAYPL